MSLPETLTPTGPADSSAQTAQVVAVLDGVRGTFHPGTRLFAAHRRDIRAALAHADIDEQNAAYAVVAETLHTAEVYEADGMYAFLPTWDLLLTRVKRPGSPTGDGC